MSLRDLPAVGKLLAHPRVRAAAAGRRAEDVADALRDAVAAERARRLAGEPGSGDDRVIDGAIAALEAATRPRLRRVVNATGVVLNTNLGRAPLAPEAIAAIAETAAGYCNLELDLDTGARGSRHAHVEDLVARLTGAEAAVVVNNGAAAVLLLADTFARGREAVVSRGQLVEIGGGFRLPEVLEASGARLREVGTTNRTYLADYAGAIGPETGLLLLSHTSNFRVVGFTAAVAREDLAALGRERGVVTAEDLGAGLLVDLAPLGLPPEPTVQASVAAGLDVVAVSGDKLLGGPQAGILAGRREAIARLRKNPLMRALRPDKLAIAALEATLRLYLSPDHGRIPVLALLAKEPAALRAEAAALAAGLAGLGLDARVEAGRSAVGGGTLPGVELETWLVTLGGGAGGDAGGDAEALARALRTGEPAVVGRIAEGRLALDPRTFVPGDADRVIEAFRAWTSR